MKKIISVTLSIMMLISLCGSAFAEITSVAGFTAEDVLTWLKENDDAVDSANLQVVNGAHRLAEMLVLLASPNANEEQAARLNEYLDALSNARQDTEHVTAEQSMAVGCIEIVQTLKVLAEQIDANGDHAANLNSIIDEFAAGDEAAQNAEGQTVNALYSAVKLTALITGEISTSQEQLAQIEAGMSEFAAGDEAATNVREQMANGAKWLSKMLGAFVKLQDASKVEAIENLASNTEDLVAQSDSPLQLVTDYLYNGVHTIAILLGVETA